MSDFDSSLKGLHVTIYVLGMDAPLLTGARVMTDSHHAGLWIETEQKEVVFLPYSSLLYLTLETQ